MGAAAVLLTVPQGSPEGTYSFVCPSCRETIEKHADRKVVMLLLSAGVEVQEVEQLTFQAESEIDSRRSHPAGKGGDGDTAVKERSEAPPFTVDDLIDFHFMLRDDSWFRQLIAASE
jgi:hypothetical protein